MEQEASAKKEKESDEKFDSFIRASSRKSETCVYYLVAF